LRKFLEYKANDSKISNSLIGFENQDKYADEKINLDKIINKKCLVKPHFLGFQTTNNKAKQIIFGCRNEY
jgi:hypothetical protein